jgi:hypothetical protein
MKRYRDFLEIDAQSQSIIQIKRALLFESIIKPFHFMVLNFFKSCLIFLLYVAVFIL